MSAAGARARVRAELTREITDVARAHLATSGAAALSLRAVARELGMASSAVYRYFPSRDELLTALIVDAYSAIGAAVEDADAAERAAGASIMDRWRSTTRAARAWALAHPHEYALLYGSPVPGYAAPQTTIDPAGRVAQALITIVRDAHPPAPPAHQAVATLDQAMIDLVGLPAALAVRMVEAWVTLFGTISFELFGQSHNVVADHAGWFDHVMEEAAERVGLR